MRSGFRKKAAQEHRSFNRTADGSTYMPGIRLSNLPIDFHLKDVPTPETVPKAQAGLHSSKLNCKPCCSSQQWKMLNHPKCNWSCHLKRPMCSCMRAWLVAFGENGFRPAKALDSASIFPKSSKWAVVKRPCISECAKACISECAKEMLTPQLMLCLCTHSLSLRAGIADSHDCAGLHTPGFSLRKVLIASLLLKMNQWVLLGFENCSNLDSSCKICVLSLSNLWTFQKWALLGEKARPFLPAPAFFRAASAKRLHSESGSGPSMQLQPSNRGSIYVLQALIEAPTTVTLLSPLQLSIVGKVMASTSRF